MKKNLIDTSYTPEFNQTLEYIQHCLQNKTLNPKKKQEVSWDMIFWSVFLFIKHRRYSQLFWRLVWINDHKVLDKYFKKYIDWKFSSKKEKFKLTVYHFDPDILSSIQELVEKGIPQLGIMSLLYVAISRLSPKVYNHLNEQWIDIQTLDKNLSNLTHNSALTAMWLFAFLKTFRKILSDLHLDIKDLDMLHMTEAENIDQFINNFESDVMDQWDEWTSKSSTKTKIENEIDNKLTIEHFGVDLTLEAKNKQLDPCIGREREIEQMQYTLLRKTKNNPLLIWEAGVGKTAIVEWLAHKIMLWNVPDKLKDKKIFMLDMGTLVAWTKYRGEFEARFKAIMEEASDVTNNIILFIDEIHTIIGAGSWDKTGDAAQLLKPKLARGKIKLIGATTYDEYQQHIESDAALKRRFQEVNVGEPTSADTKLILMGLKQNYEEFHWVVYDEAAFDAAIKLSNRYILNKHLPDKAIDIIDEAGARQSTKAGKLDNDEEYQSQTKRLNAIEKELESVIVNQDYFAAAELKKEQDTIKKAMQNISRGKNLPVHMRPIVTAQHIWQVLADKTGLPLDIVSESEIHKLTRLKEDLEKKIIWQGEAVDAIVRTMQRSRLSVIEHKKPIASFLFLWPSWVGKTHLAKLIAEDYFNDEKALIRIDMSEYMEKYSVSKLIWSAPWYVGFESGGMLTEQVRRKPYSVILFDEIEKASPDVLNILLQVLDEWQLKDSKWRWINFTSTVIIMTSNLWHQEFGKKTQTIWFWTTKWEEKNIKDFESIKSKVMEHVKDFLTPELRNRIDYTIIFKPLSKENLVWIMKIKLDKFLAKRAESSPIKLPKFTNKKITEIIDEIHDPAFGARPLEKYIHDKIEPSLIQKVIEAAIAKK